MSPTHRNTVAACIVFGIVAMGPVYASAAVPITLDYDVTAEAWASGYWWDAVDDLLYEDSAHLPATSHNLPAFVNMSGTLQLGWHWADFQVESSIAQWGEAGFAATSEAHIWPCCGAPTVDAMGSGRATGLMTVGTSAVCPAGTPVHMHLVTTGFTSASVFNSDGSVLVAQAHSGAPSAWWWAEAGASYRFESNTLYAGTVRLPEPGGLALTFSSLLPCLLRRRRSV